MISLERHLDPVDLAQLAEGSAATPARDQAARHLAGCPRCTAIYAEFAQAHLDSSYGSRPSNPDEWVRLGFEIGPHTVPQPRRRPRGRLVLSGAAVVSLLAAMTLLAQWRPAPMRTPAEPHSLIARLARQDSYGGLLYSAQLLPEPSGSRGNGHVTEVEELNELRRQVSLHPDDAGNAFWLIVATLSTNQRRAAAVYLTDALQSFPNDPVFANLAAILAYKYEDLDGAERHLRAGLPADRTGVVKLNLVHVLTQLGRRSEAEQLAAELRREHADLAVAAGL